MELRINTKVAAAASAVLVVVLAGAGCGSVGGDDEAGEDGAQVNVGYIGPITGEYADWGENHLAALELAASEWNDDGGLFGQDILVTPGDSQGVPRQAAALAQQFVDDDIRVVIGPTFSLEAETAVPIFCAQEIVSVTGIADLLDQSDTPCYHRTSPREDLSARFAARVVIEYLEADSVAIIDDGKSDTVTTAEHAKKAFEEAGIEVVFAGGVTAGEQDYAATLTKIDSLEPDAILAATVNPESAILRKQGSELGIDADWVVAQGSADEQFGRITAEKGIPTYSYTPSRDGERFAAFERAFEATSGMPPANLPEYTYDAANVLFTAIEEAGSLDFDAVTEAVESTEEYPGITGPITFDDTGSRGAEPYDILEYGEGRQWAPVENGLDQ